MLQRSNVPLLITLLRGTKKQAHEGGCDAVQMFAVDKSCLSPGDILLELRFHLATIAGRSRTSDCHACLRRGILSLMHPRRVYRTETVILGATKSKLVVITKAQQYDSLGIESQHRVGVDSVFDIISEQGKIEYTSHPLEAGLVHADTVGP